MKKFVFIALMSAALAGPAFAEDAAPAAASSAAAQAPIAASDAAQAGRMVYAAGGATLGPVNRFGPDGSPRVIFQGRMVTVPLSSISIVDGRMVSSMTRAQIMAAN